MLVMDGDERWAGNLVYKMAPVEALETQYRPAGKYGGDFSVRPHATMEEIARMALAAGVKHLVLTHFRAGRVDEESVRAMLRAGGFKGRVTFGVDGLEVRGMRSCSGRRMSPRLPASGLRRSCGRGCARNHFMRR